MDAGGVMQYAYGEMKDREQEVLAFNVVTGSYHPNTTDLTTESKIREKKVNCHEKKITFMFLEIVQK